MITPFDLISWVSVAIGFSVFFGALVWKLKMIYHESEEDLHTSAMQLFRGTTYGGFKLFLIYFVVVPLLPELPISLNLINFFHILLIGLVFILGVELFVYVFTYFSKYEKEIYTIGIIGGITRSEAVTAEFMDEVRRDSAMLPQAVNIVMVASTVMLFRNAALLLFANFALFLKSFIPLIVMGIISAIIVIKSTRMGEKRDIRLKAVSLRTAFKIVVFFALVTGTINIAATYGGFSLYAVAIIGALGGALPVVFSIITMVKIGTISLDVGGLMIILASIVAYINDIFVTYVFKQKDFSKELLKKQWIVALIGILTIYLLSYGYMFPSAPSAIFLDISPIYLLFSILSIFAIGLAIYFYSKRASRKASSSRSEKKMERKKAKEEKARIRQEQSQLKTQRTEAKQAKKAQKGAEKNPKESKPDKVETPELPKEKPKKEEKSVEIPADVAELKE
ncbi:DUF4010 domain-containing protein [Candidatus Undinarchaeota archaeon]